LIEELKETLICPDNLFKEYIQPNQQQKIDYKNKFKKGFGNSNFTKINNIKE